jgi:thiol-disulfide isomerase/thioredoxin
MAFAVEKLVVFNPTRSTAMRSKPWRGVLIVVAAFSLMLPVAAADEPTLLQKKAVPPVTEATANSKEASPATMVWPEGATVSGRVLDHRGAPVENAEVLLLGQERIIVDADRRNWFVPERESPRPPSTRSDRNGAFKITRERGTADRLAVIAQDPLFWVVSRNRLQQADNVELKLPAAGTIAVQCDLPNKPSKMPVIIELTSFDGVTWHSDSLRFHMSSYSLVNPGEKVFEHLSPGHYAVQLYNEARTGANSRLLTDMDRQLVEVASEKQSSIRFDRKIGRPLAGQVLGMENADLRYALLTIHHAGPEEVLGNDGRRGRRYLAFDVISINSDGRFTTDPIPPGKYTASLFAVLASTPQLSSQSSDFSGQGSFTVPEQGDLPKVEIVAKANARPNLSTVTDLRIRAVDEEGKPVSKLQAMIHTAEAGYGPWVDGGEGIVFLGGPSQYRAAALDVMVRADGFATGFARFEGEQRDKLSKGEATVMLRRGKPVQLRFNLPQELTWPKGMLPETYFDNMQERVRIMRQSVNRRPGAVVDFNILNLREIGESRFEFRVAQETPRFHVAIHAPGFLQFFEAGSFTLADVKNGNLELDVPRPGTVEVSFEPGEHARAEGPFESASLNLMRQLQGDSYLTVATSAVGTLTPKMKVTDLAPGNYLVDVRTQPKDESKPLPDSQINLGAYFDRRNVTLAAGQSEQIDFRSVPYLPNAFRGSRTAVVRIKAPDGKPATDRNVQINYFDGHYGSQVVFEGNVPASGDIVLSGITDKVPSSSRPNRAYSVSLQGKRLGSFAFAKESTTEEFDFVLTPVAGDLAPDVELTNLTTDNVIKLSSLRGKVVFLEFWATWCGPCQEPMAKLNTLVTEQSAAWKDRVVIVPVSIDGEQARVKSHVQSRSWTGLDHFWTGGSEGSDFDAPAARSFVVSGVPEAVLIGPDGRIRWRGHPLEQFSGKNLKVLIDDALK